MSPRKSRGRVPWLPWLLAGLALAGLAIATAPGHDGGPPPPAPVTRVVPR